METGPDPFSVDDVDRDLILMTAEANLATQHGVPELDTADAVGLSGSLVWRTAIKRLSPQQLAQAPARDSGGKDCLRSLRLKQICPRCTSTRGSLQRMGSSRLYRH